MIVFILFYFLFLPRIVRSRTEKFNRKALLLLTSGQARALPGLVKRSILLQLFGPRGPLDAKLALAYVQCEEYRAAIPCFESGIPTAPPTEQVALQTGLAKALFAAGEFRRAEAEAEAIAKNVTRLPELLVITARSRVALGKLDDETSKLLDEAEKLSPSDDVSLMITLTRIEFALLTGRKTSDLPEKSDSSYKLMRAWIHLVRGQLREHRKDKDKAIKSYSKAMDTLPGSFASKLADRRLRSLSSAGEQASESGGGKPLDPVVRRKKKRRR